MNPLMAASLGGTDVLMLIVIFLMLLILIFLAVAVAIAIAAGLFVIGVFNDAQSNVPDPVAPSP